MICHWVAWRNSQRNFGPWHRQYGNEHTVCGKLPEGIISERKTAPKPKDECRTCWQRDQLRVRLAPSHPFGRNR